MEAPDIGREVHLNTKHPVGFRREEEAVVLGR